MIVSRAIESVSAAHGKVTVALSTLVAHVTFWMIVLFLCLYITMSHRMWLMITLRILVAFCGMITLLGTQYLDNLIKTQSKL